MASSTSSRLPQLRAPVAGVVLPVGGVVLPLPWDGRFPADALGLEEAG